MTDDWQPVNTDDFQPVDTGFSARVETYRPRAEAMAAQELPTPDITPNIPIVTPLMKRGVAYVGSLFGAGEGETTSERYQNALAMEQALEEERAKRAAPGSSVAKAAGDILVGAGFAPELGVEAGIAKLGAPTVARYAAPIIESGLYGAGSQAAEIIPDESWSDYSKRTGEGALWGSAAVPALKGVTYIGGKAYNFVKPITQSLFDPERGAIEQVVRGAGEAGPSTTARRGISIDEFQKRAMAGEDVNIADIQGVRPLLESAAGRGKADLVDSLNDVLSQRVKEAGENVGFGLDNLYGKTLDAGASREKALELARNANKPAYESAYSKPIDYASTTGQKIEDIINNRVPAAALKRANEMMRLEGKQSNQIMANIADDGTVSFQRLPDTMQVDYITRALNDMAKSGEGAGAMGGQTQLGSAYQGLARELRSSLRDAVPEYGAAVDGAGRYIKQNNAFDAGQDFFKLITNKKADPKDVSDQLRQFTRTDGKQYTPEERMAFSEGFANFVKENPEIAAKVFAKGDTQTMKRFEMALGSKTFNAIDDILSANRIAAMTKEIGARQSQGMTAGPAAALGAGLATAAEGAVPAVWQHITTDPIKAIGAGALIAGGAATGMAIKSGMNAVASKRADALLQLALSDQKDAAAKLLDFTRQSTQNRAALHDLEERISRFLSTQSYSVGQPAYDRMQRKSGGRVSATENAASALVREANRAKNMISNHTERMLSLPDDTVVHALSIAKKIM